MQKKKITKFIVGIDFGMFPGQLAFCVGHDYDSLKKTISKEWGSLLTEEDREVINSALGVLLHRRKMIVDSKGVETAQRNYFFLILPEFRFRDDDYVTLSHELVHLCQFYLPGINVNRDQEYESEAYFHSFMMEQCLKVLRKKLKRKN